ncbi:serine/threonine protein kinase [Paenibacillus hodogayensis]|uniref:Serine/threonine protein kinase n=1 Tax=Paenibacillus hodogayensis TaxID=279208 RepID=A0ABV5W3X9_9BACL
MNRFFDEAPDLVRIVGTVFGGRYRIVRPLGEGGMSTVFLADDLKLPGKRWAVKRTREQGISELSAAREAAVLMKLSHPYLPHVVDFFPPDEEGFSHLVMEYIEGSTLQQLFDSHGGTLPPKAVIRYAMQLCELLQYMHELDSGPVIFRDIKPSNIMIDARDHVRLIDFGIARRQTPGRAADTVALGTIGFAAPELLEHGSSDYRSDLYSLGATLYYLLSEGRTYHAIRKPLELAGGERERLLGELVGKLLDNDPMQRPPSASAVRSMLEQCLESERGRAADSAANSQAPLYSGRRLRIVVGGLYAGAGATFTAVALAVLLGDAGIANAVVEHPGVRPDLFGMLDGDRNAPARYDYWSARHDAGEASWTSRHTEWVALDPRQPPPAVSPGNMEQRLYRIQAAVTIIDIGDRWLEPDVAELLDEADILVAVADPVPSRWMLPSARGCADLLQRLHEAGRHVAFIANKSASFQGSKEWLGSFPLKPAAVIPSIPFEEIVRSLWKGEPVQQQPGVKPQLHKALGPWLGKTAAQARQSRNGASGKGWLGKIFSLRS